MFVIFPQIIMQCVIPHQQIHHEGDKIRINSAQLNGLTTGTNDCGAPALRASQSAPGSAASRKEAGEKAATSKCINYYRRRYDLYSVDFASICPPRCPVPAFIPYPGSAAEQISNGRNARLDKWH